MMARQLATADRGGRGDLQLGPPGVGRVDGQSRCWRSSLWRKEPS